MKQKKVISKRQIQYIIDRYRIRCGPLMIREDGSIDVNGNVKICDTNLRKLPLKFGNVYGDFLCHSNNLTTLKGCPKYVAGDFNCGYNLNLKSLKFGPEEVGGDYSCMENSLVDLKGCPKEIKGNFNAFLNQLTTLKDGPEKVGRNCYLHHNNLTSLSGLKHIGASLYVSANALIDLKGCPEYIGDILSFDNDVRLDLGNENCYVKSVVIQMQETTLTAPEKRLPDFVVQNQQFLPVLFRYFKYVTLYDEGRLIEYNFNEIISEIKDGLR